MNTTLIFLHGALGTSAQLKPLQKELSARCSDIRLFDFPGHAGKPFPETPFRISLFANEVVKWMDHHHIPIADFFGYSMGGYVALYLARHHPDRVGKVMTLATKFEWDESTSSREVKFLDPVKIETKVPHFAKALHSRHAPLDWKEVMKRTAEMMESMGKIPEMSKDDLSSIQHSVLLSVGDRDSMVSVEETHSVYRHMPNGQFAVIPNTPHPVEQMDASRVAETARKFF